jgi:hypothetical protein
MSKWLHAHQISFKKLLPTPAKVNPQKQKEFIEFYKKC